MAALDHDCMLTALQHYDFFKERKDQCIENSTLTRIKDDLFGLRDKSLSDFKAMMPNSISEWYVTNPNILPYFKKKDDTVDADRASQFEDIVAFYKKPVAPLSCTLYQDQIDALLARFSYFYNVLNPKNRIAYFVGLPNEIDWNNVKKVYYQEDVRFLSFGIGNGVHWTCFFVDTQKDTYEYYDSKGHAMSSMLKATIQHFLPKKIWEEHQMTSQKDNKSCGMYVAAYTFFRTFMDVSSQTIINSTFLNDAAVQNFFKHFVIEKAADKNVFEALHPSETADFHPSETSRRLTHIIQSARSNQPISTTPYHIDFVSIYAVYNYLCKNSSENPSSAHINFLEQVWRSFFHCLKDTHCVRTPKCESLTGCQYIKCMIEDSEYDSTTFTILKKFATPVRNTDGTIDREKTIEHRQAVQHQLYKVVKDKRLFMFYSLQTPEEIQEQTIKLFKALKDGYTERLNHMPPPEKEYYTNAFLTVSSVILLLGLISRLYA